jgi:hypothetical protein
MPDESDSPDHGRGRPTVSEAERSVMPGTDGERDGARPAGDEPIHAQQTESEPEPEPPPISAPPDGAGSREEPPPAPAHPPLHMATSSPPPPPLAAPLPPPDPVGLPRPTGNGDAAVPAEEQQGLPSVPITRPSTPPYIGPPEAMPRPPAVDPAAGLPATPYLRSGPVARRQFRSRRRGRYTPAPTEGRRVVHRLRQISPWSVFKVAILFYLCIFLMFMVASVLLWKIGRTTETIDQAEELITRLGAYGRCVPEADIQPGTDFANDDDCPEGEVIVDGFHFNDATLFKAALLGGLIFVVAGTAITVLLTILLNLLNDVTGGVRYETVREPGPERANAPPAAVAAGPPSPLASQRTDGFGPPPSR